MSEVPEKLDVHNWLRINDWHGVRSQDRTEITINNPSGWFQFEGALHGLRNFGSGIEIPIVLAAVSNEEAAEGFNLADQILSLHGSVSSASFRTPGTAPLVKSL